MKKVLLFLMPLLLSAQNLNELIELSMKNSLIRSSSHELQSIKSEYESSKSSYKPDITIGANYSNANKETASAADSSISAYGKLSYMIYDGGKKRNTFDGYESSIKSSSKNLENLKNQISLQVVNYYFNYLSLVANKEAKLKEIEKLKAQQIRLQRFLEAGTTTDDEVQKIISRVQSANVALHEIELSIQTILHNLEYITGETVSIDEGSLIQKYFTSDQGLRADIKALEYEMYALLANAKSQKSATEPIFSLDNTFNYYDPDYNNKMYDSGIDTQNVLKLNLSWKVFDFGSTDKAYEAAYKKYLAQKSRYEYEKNRASVDLKLALKAYEIAKLKISSAQAGVKAANSTYESVEAKYHNGLIDNVAYLEALSEKYQASSVLKSARYDLQIKQADIIYHSGKKLTEYIK